MRILIVIAFLGILVGSCKKFDHQEVKEIPDCTYCHLADSIEGSYTGRLVERNYFPSGINTGNGIVFYDTVIDIIITVQVDRTFEGFNYYEDSTIFKFNSSHFYNEIFLTETSIQNGRYIPENHRITQRFTEDNKMIFSREAVFDKGPAGLHYYIDYEFIGYKDE